MDFLIYAKAESRVVAPGLYAFSPRTQRKNNQPINLAQRAVDVVKDHGSRASFGSSAVVGAHRTTAVTFAVPAGVCAETTTGCVYTRTPVLRVRPTFPPQPTRASHTTVIVPLSALSVDVTHTTPLGRHLCQLSEICSISQRRRLTSLKFSQCFGTTTVSVKFRTSELFCVCHAAPVHHVFFTSYSAAHHDDRVESTPTNSGVNVLLSYSRAPGGLDRIREGILMEVGSQREPTVGAQQDARSRSRFGNKTPRSGSSHSPALSTSTRAPRPTISKPPSRARSAADLKCQEQAVLRNAALDSVTKRQI
ncbi:hypothetical protein B0H12DRAFT_1075897 [Mycena haematopus]|nr:hypothetical protein B0H12DRAFT_1075897 [Mycena haematopus]